MSRKTAVNVCNCCTVGTEIFKTLNNIDPSFVKEIFRLRITKCPTREKHKLNLKISMSKQVRFGIKCLRYLGYHIKSSENLKTLIKSWNGTNCTCKICQI